MSSVANFVVKPSPLQISHLKQFPVTTISFNLAPGASLGAGGEGRSTRRSPTSTCRRASPSAIRARRRRSSRRCRTRCSCSAAAIATMYIVLGVLYESFIHPITILTTLPSAGIGALLALNSAGAGLDIIGVIGIVLLIGIVKKNAIMMIDFALEAQRQRGPAGARGDLSGLPAAPAADPDDDGRGDFRRAAADARHGRRLGAAPSARPRDRRRPRVQPGADALHDAGHLSLLREARRALRPRRG